MVSDDRTRCGPGLDGIARGDYSKPWHRAHYGEILERVMRGSHRAIGEEATHGNDFHIGVVVANIVADLLKAAHRWEIGDRVGECNLAAESHSGGHAGHILFGHAGV